jgi:MoxR-like ATPase
VVERLLLTILCNGNVLVEGLPGLAKTRAVKSLAENLEADFSSIYQFLDRPFLTIDLQYKSFLNSLDL